MNEFIVTYFGDWILEYPYTYGAVEIVIFIFIAITLQNLWYQLIKLFER